MGCQSSKRDYIIEILEQSKGKVSSQDTAYLQAHTNFTPAEIHSLYKQFINLESPSGAGLSVYQFMKLEQLSHCPLVPRLFYALHLQEQLLQHLSGQKFKTQQQQERQNSQIISAAAAAPEKPYSRRDAFYRAQGPKLEMVDASTVMLHSKYSCNQQKQEGIQQFEIRFITFPMFVRALAVFAPAASAPIKTNFLFRVFDMDEDGVLSFDDIVQGVTMLHTDFTQNTCYLQEHEITSLVHILFVETSTQLQEGISYEDFQMFLWQTDFDKNCTLHF